MGRKTSNNAAKSRKERCSEVRDVITASILPEYVIRKGIILDTRKGVKVANKDETILFLG